MIVPVTRTQFQGHVHNAIFALSHHVPSEFLIVKERMAAGGHLAGVPIWDKNNLMRSDQPSALPIRNDQVGSLK